MASHDSLPPSLDKKAASALSAPLSKTGAALGQATAQARGSERISPAREMPGKSPASIIRTGWLVVLFGFFGFFIWAALAPLDSGITAMGEIVVDSKRQKVQHLSGGIVDQILVRDGDSVTQDQVLIRLNRTRTQAELAIVRAQLLSSLAVEARLMAERDSHERIRFPDQVIKEQANDARISEVVDTQMQLFETRRRALKNELSILDESVRGLNEQMRGVQAQRRGKERQLELLREELASLQTLFEEGYVPRNRIFELERAMAETDARLSEDIAAAGRIQSSLSEARLRKIQREQEYTKEVESQLTNIQREVDGLQQRSIALYEDLERVDIRAPVAGVVVGLKIHSTGGVVRPGEDILEIVPDNDPLVIEAMIPTQSIELVQVGLEAMIRFSALSRLNPVIDGTVMTVSADRLTDERTGMPYYKARIQVSPEELARLDYERIVPGMPAEVVIKTGEHSVLHYLLKPLLDHVFSAFRER
jgi:membrane fusion protein, protease secretion system